MSTVRYLQGQGGGCGLHQPGQHQGQGGHVQGQQQGPAELPPQGLEQGVMTWATAPPQGQ
eukprot:7411952-Prorocentrum_lima.AAC.1